MSGKTVTLENSDKWGYFWLWGRETFYEEIKENTYGMITFPNPGVARQWLKDNHKELKEAIPEPKQGRLL